MKSLILLFGISIFILSCNNSSSHKLQAWTQEGDLVPTLYVQGEIKANGKPQVDLIELSQEGDGKNNLNLGYSVDAFDPKSESWLLINKYSLPISSLHEYKTVTIKGEKGDLKLDVEFKQRK